MDLTSLISKGGVFTVEGSSTTEIYEKVCNLIKFPESITSDAVFNALCAREKIMSTAVGNGIALPHSRYPILKNSDDQRIIVCYLKETLQMNAPDGRLVGVMFILLTSSPQFHLKVLSQLAFLFQNKDFRNTLDKKPNEAELIEAIKKVL